MRYIDTGRRDPNHALGSWLAECSAEASSLVSLRIQSGFFGATALPFLASIVTAIAARGGLLRVLVGSNDGGTSRADIELLLLMAEPRQELLEIGVVSFAAGYFHPKTIHLTRDDGSAIAYVGSANVTGNGVSSLHVEAGLLLDTRVGDDPAVLAEIADAVDWWFIEQPHGFSRVAHADDLSALSDAGILDRPRPQPMPRETPNGSASALSSLSPLVQAPARSAAVRSGAQRNPTVRSPRSSDAAAVGVAVTPQVMAEWTKQLSASDAQRKPTGNQRGSVTLVQAGHPIDARTYFRNTFFGEAAWSEEFTRTNEVRESAVVVFACSVLGVELGPLPITVTFATNREAAQANYTSLLHLGPLADEFAAHDLTGRRLELLKFADGQFSLKIS